MVVLVLQIKPNKIVQILFNSGISQGPRALLSPGSKVTERR